MKKIILQSLKLFLILTIITGVIYPLAITVIAQTVFPKQANGSLVRDNGKIVGSELMAQKFTSDKYFWARPSAVDYNMTGGSNLGPTSQKLLELVKSRRDTIILHSGNVDSNNIPQDLLFASGSGVDPEIGTEAAYFQIARVAKARNFDDKQKQKLVELVNASVRNPQLGILGMKRVNVLLLNINLDKIK